MGPGLAPGYGTGYGTGGGYGGSYSRSSDPHRAGRDTGNSKTGKCYRFALNNSARTCDTLNQNDIYQESKKPTKGVPDVPLDHSGAVPGEKARWSYGI
jgi:hypothetical protein